MKNENYQNPNNSWFKNPMPKTVLSYKVCLYLFIAAFIFLFVLLFTGCKNIQYVPVETVKTEYVNRMDTFIQKDSILVKDSASIIMVNDTVFKEMWHTVYKYKWRDVVKIDSFIKTDSVQVPYPVERNLSRWEKLKMDAGGIALGACLLFIILIIVSWLRKRNR